MPLNFGGGMFSTIFWDAHESKSKNTPNPMNK
jgi:hypothetical protein